MSENKLNDEDVIEEELAATYRLMHREWEEAYLTLENHKKTIGVFQKEKEKLVSTITGLEEEVTLIDSKLKNMTKFMHMLNNGSNILNEILKVGKMS